MKAAALVFIILGEAALAGEPGEGALDDPAFRLHLEACPVAASDDLQHPAADPSYGACRLLAAVAGRIPQIARSDRSYSGPTYDRKDPGSRASTSPLLPTALDSHAGNHNRFIRLKKLSDRLYAISIPRHKP
jgi:hypothetical protein